jgi:hypothetical protein
MVFHGGDREALVHEDLELRAVGPAQVRLVGRAMVGVGLDALDGRAGDLGQRGRLDLGGRVAREERLALAVAADVAALARIGSAATGRLAVAVGSTGRALRGGALARGARERGTSEREGADGGDGREPLGDGVGHGGDFLPVA